MSSGPDLAVGTADQDCGKHQRHERDRRVGQQESKDPEPRKEGRSGGELDDLRRRRFRAPETLGGVAAVLLQGPRCPLIPVQRGVVESTLVFVVRVDQHGTAPGRDAR